MIMALISENKEKIGELILNILSKEGNINIGIIKDEDIIKVVTKEDLKEIVSLKEKILQLCDSLSNEKKGALYKSVLGVIEKPLIEDVLQRTEGNQLKAARILGLNRNTVRAKIRKLGINTLLYKE
jgi:DNA-binding protein Fis